MFGLPMTAAFEHIEKAREIGIEISMRILQRVTNPGLCREMHDRPEFALAKDAFVIAPRREIEFVESKIAEVTEDAEPGLLEPRIVVIVDTVHADHGAAALEKSAGQSKADEARRACN